MALLERLRAAGLERAEINGSRAKRIELAGRGVRNAATSPVDLKQRKNANVRGRECSLCGISMTD